MEKQSTYSKEKIVGLLSSYELPCVTESKFSLLTADTTDAEAVIGNIEYKYTALFT